MCGCVSRGSFPKCLRADSNGTNFHCTVQSCELTKNLILTSTFLIRMVCISTVVQGPKFCSGKTATLIKFLPNVAVGNTVEKRLLMSHLGLVHIQSSWPSSTQDISRLGLGCKL